MRFTQMTCFSLSDLLSCNTQINEIVQYALPISFEITRGGLITLVQAIKSKPDRKIILD